jgi:hypothetical protein
MKRTVLLTILLSVVLAPVCFAGTDRMTLQEKLHPGARLDCEFH